jgi:hypothetical protein
MGARAELVFSTIAEPGTVLPGSGVGETYTVSSVDEARAFLDGRVYFWARATSSLAISGTREGIWSWQDGSYALELLEGDAVAGGGGGLRVGKFNANEAGDVIRSFTINPSGALLVAVRLRGGNTDASSDEGIIYHHAGVNTLLERSALADANYGAGVTLLAGGAAYTEFIVINNAVEQFLSVGLPVQGLPGISAVANSLGGVIGENGAQYLYVAQPCQDAGGTVGYLATVLPAGGGIESRIGVYSGPYTFPIVTGTAIAGTGGALTIDTPYDLLPAPGGGWLLTGSVDAGGGSAGIVLPFLYRGGSLLSLFPGGVLAAIFGEDGKSVGIDDLGIGLDGDIGFVITFAPTNGGLRHALVRRNAAGAYRLLLEEDTLVRIDGVMRAVLAVSPTSQPFTRNGAVAFRATLDGNQRRLLVAKDTTERPSVRVESPRRHVTRQPRLVVRGSAADDGTVTEVRYRVNRSGERAANGTSRWNFTTPRLREGRNRIAIRAVDGDGGSSAPARLIIRLRPR